MKKISIIFVVIMFALISCNKSNEDITPITAVEEPALDSWAGFIKNMKDFSKEQEKMIELLQK